MAAPGVRDRVAAALAWNAALIAQGSTLAWTAAQTWRLPADDAPASHALGRLGPLEVRLAHRPKDVRRAQRARYKVFFEEGHAVPDRMSAFQRRDICPYDAVADHLIVIDHDHPRIKMGNAKPRVVGTYRLLRQSVADRNFGFYTEQEFDIAPLLARHPGKRFLELGRSCVLPDYRSKRTIELLWRGIGVYAARHAIDVLFGCASLPGTDPVALARSLSVLRHHAGVEPAWQATPRPGRSASFPLVPAESVERRTALAGLPPLVKGYLRAGARFCDGAVVDHAFGTTDVLAIMPLDDLGARYMSHFGAGRA